MDTIRSSQITKAIQRISESVFVGLCYEMGTSQLVTMRRDVTDIMEKVRNKVKTSDEDRVMVSGSHGEGFRLKGSDVDFMTWKSNFPVIWDLSQSQYYNTYRQTLMLCDCSDSPPGFTLLYLLSPGMERGNQGVCVRMNNRYYVSSSKYRQFSLFESLPHVSHNLTPHGPCASGTFGTLEYDHAGCFVSDFWPPSASSWIDRCHSWPQPHVVDDIVKNGCHFVAIGHKLGHHDDHEWRISFSQAEQKLVFVMNHCQFLTYGLLKLILTEIINNGVGDDDKLLCSYHMKTVVFWVIQQNTIPHWCPQNLPDNKLSYRANKMSCYMLKLAARFGFITDMLYIAMYYYKTHRYMEALSFVEMTKVKLAQPYVMYLNYVDREMYTEAVGGQSWSTKMTQAVAENVRLNNSIHYINELIPELQSALQNHRTLLFVPSLVLLYMLEILCYRHVDTMRVQTALDDLQTLVHYDQGQFIDLDLRDMSWQILGICQQVTGDFQAALYSYQLSLRQEPYNKVHTATEMRIQSLISNGFP